MENLSGMREYNPLWDGKPSFRPPKSPLPTLSPFITDHGPNNFNGSRGIPRPREGQRQHQRTSSESFLVEEQPSWLDDLLDEPETPVTARKAGHRRSSSDSFTHWDMPNISSFMDGPTLAPMDHRNRGIGNPASWASQEYDRSLEVQHRMYSDVGNYRKLPSRGAEAAMTVGGQRGGFPSMKDRFMHQRSVSSGNLGEPDFAKLNNNSKRQDGEDYMSHDPKCGYESNDTAAGKNCQSESEQKRAKQRFAQRSRVRKLQYIAELERTVQALQAEGSEVTAELQFLNDQNIMLSLENETLKQRLQSLAQEHYIKHLTEISRRSALKMSLTHSEELIQVASQLQHCTALILLMQMTLQLQHVDVQAGLMHRSGSLSWNNWKVQEENLYHDFNKFLVKRK